MRLRGLALALLAVGLLLSAGWWVYRMGISPEQAASGDETASAADSGKAKSSRTTQRQAYAADATGKAAVPTDGCLYERRRQVRALQSSLDPAASPEDALTHALLQRLATAHPESGGQAALAAIVAARRRWPDDLDLAWLEASLCEAPACDVDAAQDRLLARDPRNAAAWLMAMQRAASKHDIAAYDDALHHAATADFYDSRLGSAFLRLRPALATLPLPNSCRRSPAHAGIADTLGREPAEGDWADLEAHAVEMAIALPGMSSLRRCDPQNPAWSPARRSDCIAVLEHVSEGDTLLEQSLALGMLIRLVDGPDGAVLRERYRRLRWLQASAAGADRIEGFIPRMWSEGEVAVLQDWLQRSGRWPPPPDWLPADEPARSLILDGTQR